MSRLYLIRHGKTAANEAHLYCGSSDLPLSPAGRDALKALRYNVENVRFFTSGMRRTDETLELLFGNVAFTERKEFREIDFGAFELCSYEQLKDNPAYQAWIAGDNEQNVPPEGESGAQMKKRVLDGLPSLLEKDTVLVTHGGVIACIMEELFPKDGKNRYEWQPMPGHGYVIDEGEYRKLP